MSAEESKISKSRLEALVDGIFAFAMTLLVTGLTIPVLPGPVAAAELPALVAAMRPEFISLLIAFFILASFWLAHHRQFHHVRMVDMNLVRINLCILLCVILLPFTTSISGDYDHVRIAVDLFHFNLFFLGLFFLVHWWYVNRTPAVTNGEIPKADAGNGMRRSLIVPSVAVIGLIIAFFDPRLSMMVYLLLIPAFFLQSRFSARY
ncbi:MAG TPA: TMEM175 family protein [Methanoregulaceae archaeon]|nr:TMEM175 family protein [Methanoregulaceae archaeon]